MTRMSTWETVGTESKTNNVLELLKEADLDYTAVTEDLFVEHEGTKIQIPNKKVVLREDTKEIFGIVSDRYQLCQNRDAQRLHRHRHRSVQAVCQKQPLRRRNHAYPRRR